MRTLTVVAVLAMTLSACGSGPSPADDLAGDDHATADAPYTAALADLSNRCTQSPEQIVAMVEKGRSLLAGRGITETDLSIARHVAKTIPAGHRMDCAQVIGAYVMLREGG